MPEYQGQSDAEIIQAAYAERVSDAFKIFTENLSTGQSEQSCALRFQRAVQLIRKTRDLAMQAMVQGNVGEAAAADPKAAATAQTAEPLSAEHQALIDSALAGTTGHAPAPPTQRYRS